MRNLRIISIIAVLFASVPALYAQQENDLALVLRTSFSDPVFNKREVKFLMSEKKSAIVKYNPVTLTLGSLLYVYQTSISQQLYSNCPYHPSCSEFGREAISSHGIFRGICLTADRLMRCNPPAVNAISPFRFDQNNRIIDDPAQYRFHP